MAINQEDENYYIKRIKELMKEIDQLTEIIEQQERLLLKYEKKA